RNAKRMGVRDSSVDDVVQEVFLVVHRRLAEYDDRLSLRGWIYGILSHVVRSYRRTLRRKELPVVARDSESSLVSAVAAPSAHEPARLAEQREAARRLQSAPGGRGANPRRAHREDGPLPFAHSAKARSARRRARAAVEGGARRRGRGGRGRGGVRVRASSPIAAAFAARDSGA